MAIAQTSQRIALGVQYDGTPFFGWQTQLHQNTIQDVLQAAINQFIGGDSPGDVRVMVAGRTDTGVHAIGQVVHFDTLIDRPMWSWVRGVNAYLPASVTIDWAQAVNDTFHARFSAFERSYAYVLVSSAGRIPLLSKKAGYLLMPHGQQLDITAMRDATQYLIGLHDFSCFRSSQCQSNTPFKTLYQLDIVEQDQRVIFFLRGNAFLHHMVRNIVGSLIQVGKRQHPPEWIQSLMAQKNRALAAPTFSADGLYLIKVGYPALFSIPNPNYGHSVIAPQLLEQAFPALQSSFIHQEPSWD